VNALSHQLLYLARAYPEAALARMVSTVAEVATIIELRKYWEKLKLFHAWAYPEKVKCFGNNVRG